MKCKVGITGGIGSGKSFVCRKLAERGITVYDCDTAAKRLMRSSTELQKALTALIGPDTYTDGQLNKARVAAFLLASDNNKRAINAIVHPAVANDFLESGSQWMECAILYESGFDSLVDVVVAVVAPEDVRINRITERDGITADKARQWIAQQMPQNEVADRADYTIVNDGVNNIDKELENIINKLKE